MANPLQPARLVESLKAELEASGSQLRRSSDALAALFHCIMLALDFRFLGLGESDTGTYL